MESTIQRPQIGYAFEEVTQGLSFPIRGGSGDSSNTASEELRTRRRHQKSRRGCLTCKKRRVKCDEARPGCNRCKKFDVSCDGYIDEELPIGSRPLAPKQDQQEAKRPPEPRTLVPISRLPREISHGLSFSNEQEMRYFRYYCDEVSAQISGTFMTTLWDRLIPQAGEIEPVIRHAIVALGALSKSRLTSPYTIMTCTPKNPSIHLQRGLYYYGMALKAMRAKIQTSNESPRTILLTCILFFCLETMQGSIISATAHASNGANLHYRWILADKLPAYPLFPSTQSTQNPIIELDLYLAFESLDIQALGFLENRPSAVHRSFVAFLEEVIARMPGTFATLEECKRWWHVVLRRNLHVIVGVRRDLMDGVSPSHGTKEDVRTLLYQSFSDSKPGNTVWCHSGRTTHVASHEMLMELQRCREDIERWERASGSIIGPLIDQGKGTKDEWLARVLMVQKATNLITLASTLSPPETAYDDFMSEFRTIVTLASCLPQFSPSADRGPVFQFPIAVVPGLYNVGLRCRDKVVRGQAIDMLLKRPGYQEGLWDAFEMGRLAALMRDIEEVGMDDMGYIPAASRASWMGAEVYGEEKMTHVHYVLGIGTGGDEVVKTKILKW